MAFFGHLRHLKSQLDLTDDQVTQLKTIAQSLRDQNAQYRDQLHGGMQQVAQTLIKDPSNVAAAQAILDGQSTAENAMKKNALNAASKALQVLTADQRAKLGDALASMSATAQGHRRGLFR
jgi:Spy/CpxP family protein refolding chaperone